MEKETYDCIIIGAGPGGLQASIYLGRYNRKVLIIDRSGGRTWHAKKIENFLTQKAISGKDIIKTGMEQARHFNVAIEKGEVLQVTSHNGNFEIATKTATYFAKFVVVSSGAYDNLPSLENLHKFLGVGFYTCVDCDGYHTTGKKLVILGNSLHTVHLAFAMKEMYTKDVTLILNDVEMPGAYREELEEEKIVLVTARPRKIIGDESVEGLELEDGRVIACEAIMSNFGYSLNDKFISGLGLKRDREGFKYITSGEYESSLSGLYIVGPLTRNDQAIIAAGEGAAAAIDINKRLLQM